MSIFIKPEQNSMILNYSGFLNTVKISINGWILKERNVLKISSIVQNKYVILIFKK